MNGIVNILRKLLNDLMLTLSAPDGVIVSRRRREICQKQRGR